MPVAFVDDCEDMPIILVFSQNAAFQILDSSQNAVFQTALSPQNARFRQARLIVILNAKRQACLTTLARNPDAEETAAGAECHI